MDFQFCQPKFGALPVLHYYPYSKNLISALTRPGSAKATVMVTAAMQNREEKLFSPCMLFCLAITMNFALFP